MARHRRRHQAPRPKAAAASCHATAPECAVENYAIRTPNLYGAFKAAYAGIPGMPGGVKPVITGA